MNDPFTVVPGPTPWFCRCVKRFTAGGQTYDWHDWGNGTPHVGYVYLKPEDKTAILILGFQCYFKLRSDGRCLIWHADSDRQILEFHLLNLAELSPIYNMGDVAETAKTNKTNIIYSSQTAIKLQISTVATEGQFEINCHDNFRSFAEILALVDAGVRFSFVQLPSCRTIYAVNFENGKVTAYPQDWFNNGSFDFGYQWISRVTRSRDGRIIGDGVRIDSFRLNEDCRTLERWGAYDEELNVPIL